MSEQSKQRSELYAAVSSIMQHQEFLTDLIEHEETTFRNASTLVQEHEGKTDLEHLKKLKKAVLTHKENIELFKTLQKTTRAIDKLQINWLCRNQANEFAPEGRQCHHLKT